MTSKRSGFPPVASPDARVLVLGSLPGEFSLACGEYYAQPRNVFWRIVGELYGFGHEEPCARRVEALKANRVALWDVCATAHRKGCLDSAIRNATANSFVEFFRHHPRLRLVAFNGATAAELFGRLVVTQLPAELPAIPTRNLPSTSPAHAAMTYREKLSRWRVLLEFAR